MQDEKYVKAQKRVRKIRHFYESLLTYIVINALLVIVNFLFTPDFLWFYWVTIFWGLAIVLEAINLFTIKDKLLGDEWEQKKINKFMDKEK